MILKQFRIPDSQIPICRWVWQLSVWYEWNFANKVTEANDAQNIKEPHLGWMIGFMFLVSFVGLFALVPLRKIDASLSDTILERHFAKTNFLRLSMGMHVFRL